MHASQDSNSGIVLISSKNYLFTDKKVHRPKTAHGHKTDVEKRKNSQPTTPEKSNGRRLRHQMDNKISNILLNHKTNIKTPEK